MTNSRKNQDRGQSGQASLFDIVKEQQEKRESKPRTGSFNIRNELQEMISQGLKYYNGSRYDAAARMSEL